MDATDDAPVTAEELRSKVKEYSLFLDQTLHPKLKQAVAAREETEAEIRDYEEIRKKISLMRQTSTAEDESHSSSTDGNEKESALVSLGHELVYARAHLDDASTIYIHVGMGFHVEMSLSEATAFCDKRIAFLTNHVLSKRVNEANTVAGHLDSSMTLLASLVEELQQLDVQS